MKNILLPTDFSKNSINAINYALKFFENTPCSFYLLNVQTVSTFVTDDMMVVSSSAAIYNMLIDTAKKSISNIISEIQKKHNNKNHSFHSIVDYDNFVDAINQNCDAYKIDLIITGTKGASGLEKVFFGTNTVHIIQRCKTNVLVIPDGCKFKGMDNIVFTSSMKSVYKKEDFSPLLEIADSNNSKLTVLHVVDKHEDDEQLNKNEAFFYSNFKTVTYDNIQSDDNDVYKNIHDYAIKKDMKMIAMLSKNHSFLERLFNKHAVEIFAFKIDIPFLVLHQA